MISRIILSLFIFIAFMALAACSVAPASDKVLLTAEWKTLVVFMTNGDYDLYSDNVVMQYTNGVYVQDVTNDKYETYLLNNNNTCASITYYTNGTTMVQNGYWSVSPGAKTFTMTVSNVTNIILTSTNIIVSWSRKFSYNVTNDSLRINNESDTIVFSMFNSVPASTTYVYNDIFTYNGTSYVGMIKK